MQLELNYDVDFEQRIIEEFLKMKKIILFGAGVGGARVVEYIDQKCSSIKGNIECFIDNNPLKWDSEFVGIKVKKPSDVLDVGIEADTVIVISCGEGDEILNQLNTEYGITERQVYIPDLAMLKVDDKSFIRNHISLLNMTYNMLQDDKSKRVLYGVLQYKLSHDISLIKDIADNCKDQYFDKDIIAYTKDGIFVDCGGYIGDTIESYVNHSKGVYGEVISFEADHENAEIIRNKYPCVEVKEIAVWSERTKLLFDCLGSGSGKVSEDESLSYELEVESDTIDNVCDNKRVSYIKMDIEGAEYQALLGAQKVIMRDKPKLMISVYHKQDDLIKIPLLIKSMNPDYKLYLRHYRKLSVQETVLYAV
ncbi:methyltransferase, FkbM family [Pseudobutyrivibrio sp. UC1225]|uniref:FkbM family methyltransferase n=1 Tax=Pseudobutyrivibrio sp. UC1225 TaxID=1798185 RepID=UPI0008E5E7D3|nr:FkbM family methyltransferase [Pseudobutyrivibrio sp. UC1225]SFN79142.1 methyltransferase, FkbM family [Pseudobutyrivibrio sp. UC1225]